jgi:hypothetical protein
MSVPIRTNADLRPSRLVKSITSYVRRSLVTIFRVFVIYRPLSVFFWSGLVLWLAGLVGGLRFTWLYLHGEGEGHVQSVVLTALCLTIGTLLWMMAIVADLISTNRKLLERVDQRLQRLEHDLPRRS